MCRSANNPRATLVLAAALCALAAPAALAERADRDKPVNVESDRMLADNTKKISTFEGHAVVTQGTLIIRADKIVIRQDEEGVQYGVATGNPASFRQKREGYDEYVDGDALRIEYDGKTERVEFFDNAHLHRDSGDDVRGSYISYDQKTEFFTVKSNGDAPRQSRDARVRAVIMPKKKDAPAAAPSAPLPLKNAPAITSPRQD